MKEYMTNQIRNIALVSHNGAGKTTFLERLLFDTGVTTRMGSVQNGSAAMDFEEEEIERNGSIATAVAPIEWIGHKLNFLDTPGYIDFVGEVNSALSVVESALIFVEGVAGVEVGTEIVWQAAEERGLARFLVVNKLDRDNVRMRRVTQSINENLEANFVPLQLPIGEGASFRGVVDLLTMSAFLGPENEQAAIPDDMTDEAEVARLALVEAAAEGDDKLLEKYFDDQPLTDDEIIRGLKGAMAQGLMVPVFYSAPEPGIGVGPLLDALVQLAPSPMEGPERTAATPDGDSVILEASVDGPLAAFIFKCREDAYGKMSYLRVFSGQLQSDTRVWNLNQDEEVRIGTLNLVRGKEQLSIDHLHAGDIGMVVKLGDTLPNETLGDRRQPLLLPEIVQPEPINSVAIHPVSQSDTAKMSQTLNRLAGEDLTLHWNSEPATRETILSGMGTAHLDIAIKKARSKFGLNLETSIPKVPYRETITTSADAEYTHKKQTGGAGQYARVFLRVESVGDDEEFTFSSEIFGGAISGPFVSAVEKGCRQALESGPLGGYPMVGIKAVVFDGKEHPVDSKEIAFQIAGRECFKRAALRAGPILLEPIYEISVMVPTDNMGDIMGDMNSRRARVLGMEQTSNKAIIKAEVPLAEAQSYNADLRSMTQGRGVFSMKFTHYGRVPNHIQQELVDKRRKEVEEAAS
jgi:elongation factor G